MERGTQSAPGINIEQCPQPDQDRIVLRWGLYWTLGLGVALLWTAVGCGLAFLQHHVKDFLKEWVSLQGPPLLALGTCLLMIVRSKVFEDRVRRMTLNGVVPPRLADRPKLRIGVIAIVAIVGTASLIPMGFSGKGITLVLMWGTCLLVDIAAGIVTLHILDILSTIESLQHVPIKATRYAPARTKELRDLVAYFTSFTFLVTIGYGFSLLGTLKGHWTGNIEYVRSVQLFWPFIYVPICSIALIYPHVIIHRLIRREKEQTLLSYQREIDDHLVQYGNMKTDEIQRINTLVQLFDRISATPDYVIDMGTLIRTLLPLAFNIVTLIGKAVIHLK